MALTRVSGNFVYRSTQGSEIYYFTITIDDQQRVCLKNIQTPTGIVSTTSCIPEAVVTDINTAIGQVEDLLGQTSAINGILTFAGETTKSVVFATAFANTNYRVVFSVEDFIAVRVTNKTITGFDLETNITYTGSIGYDVFI